MTINEATRNQIAAARPGANTWLSANAGSGKTRVLTDRVARLLLDGVAPQNILCLTYTKAAASEMQNRLFERLGEWAMKPDDPLRAELAELGVQDIKDLSQARRLFAGAIETPGGLKIQTIHSFCSSILRRFPLEAGVSPDFTEMDERAAKLLQAEIVEAMASDARRPLVEGVARHFTGAEFEDFTGRIVANRSGFETAIEQSEIMAWFGFDADHDIESLVSEAFTPDAKKTIRDAIPILLKHSSTQAKRGKALASIDLGTPNWGSYQALKDAMLTKTGTVPKQNYLTKDCAAEMGSLADQFIKLAERLQDLVGTERALLTGHRTTALHAFAHAFLRDYEEQKQSRGWLDFDDLINRSAALLNDADVTAWVLYRLDGGIDHILVDEAQDTSPTQWRVIESLAREFMSGESARTGAARTIFVVGDPKQSIYSFQGADPAEFSRMKNLFKTGLEDVGEQLFERSLDYSFRSAGAVLGLVDRALAQVPGLGGAFHHKAFFQDMPGRVDLWPVFEPVKEPEPADWHDPVDMLSPQNEKVQIAEAVADEIARLLEAGTIPNTKGEFRRVEAGDIMVLVQRRSPIFHEIIRACKQRDLPIAGADRLRIGGELAVKDITAILNFLATPEDDLSLATVLRSPLFGWSEDRLFRLAHGRGPSFLWAALRANPDANSAELTVLNDLRKEADFLRPYDLIDRLLTRHDGRRKFIARLGQEAVDGIDTLLHQALSYERMEVPSLTGFLTWLAGDDIEVKRELGSNSKQIRVMTVHGSKGLEAPVVILPDTAKRRKRATSEVIRFEDGRAVWAPKAADTPEILKPILQASEVREQEERNRLLYVAMTRAESWLIVAGAGDVGKDASDSWYNTIKAGMEQADAVPLVVPLEGVGLRLQTGDWDAAGLVSKRIPDEIPPKTVAPTWMTSPADPPLKQTGLIVPSELGGAKSVVSKARGENREDAKQRGRQIHRLLEFLPTYPVSQWPEIARGLLAFGEDAAPDELADELFAHAQRVLSASELAPLFAPETLAEVEISAPLEALGGRRVHGIIDRLIIGAGMVTAVDFKTNFDVPNTPEDIPEGILRQMGAYEVALSEVYPDREIRSAVLWTKTPNLMTLPKGLAIGTFRRLDGDLDHT